MYFYKIKPMKRFTFMFFALVLAAVPMSAWAQGSGDYPVNFDKDATTERTDRIVSSISLTGSADGDQTIDVSVSNPQTIYRPLLDKMFTAKAGETVRAKFGFAAQWMNGYVYIDRGCDGVFTADLEDVWRIPEGSDLMSYAYLETVATGDKGGYKSDGTWVYDSGAEYLLNPPAFQIPSELANGFYRMRYKLDWGSVDPGGRTSTPNHIIDNAGVIVDVLLNIHGDMVNIDCGVQQNGTVSNADGSALDGTEAAFGESLNVKIVPDDGFVCDCITVTYGYNLDGDSLVHSTPQYFKVSYPAYLFDSEGNFSIPADVMVGDVRIEGVFVEEGQIPQPGVDYVSNYDETDRITRTDRSLAGFTVYATAGGSSTVSIGSDRQVYHDMTSKQVSAVPGDKISISVDYTGHAMHHYLYIDLNRDGQYVASLNADGSPTANSELVAYTYYDGKNSLGETITIAPGDVSITSLPSFTLNSALPVGVYRARFKTDWDNIDAAGNPGPQNMLTDNGGYIVDFLLNVHTGNETIVVNTEHGSVNGAGNTGLPIKTPFFSDLTLAPAPAGDDFVFKGMTIKHGLNFDGPQYIHGNRQWEVITVDSDENYTLPADKVDGNIIITALWEPAESSEWQPVMIDEFNTEDGSQPDDGVWVRCPRQTSTWNRWLSDSEEVIYIEDGKLVARAIPNPDQTTDPVPMITGGVQSAGKFDFCYGKVEARILTNPHTGNFPAFWMMPSDNSNGWPNDGEIDIWEQIDNQNTAYHTVHSNWTYNLNNTGNPQSSFNETVQMDRYHTYTLEWEEDILRWYVDGRQVGSYAKSTNATNLSKGQWPFDSAFYIILNQSVGNGSWAANADVSHTYETLFDWVRVYQKKEHISGVENVAADAAAATKVYAAAGRIVVENAEADVPVAVYATNGTLVYNGVADGYRMEIPAAPGRIYIVKCGAGVFKAAM